jgi:hypothetical protein
MSLDPLSGLVAPAKTLRKRIKYVYREPANQPTPVLFPTGVQTTPPAAADGTSKTTYYIIDESGRREVTYEQFLKTTGRGF